MQASRRFQFKTVNTIMMIVAVAVCLYLAYWQAGRIEEKQQLLASYHALMEGEALQLNGITEKQLVELATQKWQSVSVSGEFLQEHAFYLDSQVYQGKPGYHYIVPLHFREQPFVILVNLGWLPAGNRQDIPEFPAIDVRQPIVGHLATPKSAMPGFEQGDIANTVQLFIDMDALSAKIAGTDGALKLAPMLIQLDEKATGGLPRQWPAYQAKIEMHEFYVLHWLAAALAVILIYIYMGYKNPAKPTQDNNDTHD